LVARARSVSIADRVARTPSRSITALHLSWRAGSKRVRLFCAEELRPSACCIVDALHTRGCEVSLFTGPDARQQLRMPAAADVLRVVWAPEVPDRRIRDRLRAGLDPEGQGDVLVLGATTPKGVIEAVDAFGAPPRRRRRRSPYARRTYLANPTLCERRLDAKGYGGGLVAAAALALALVTGLWLGSQQSTVITPTTIAKVEPVTRAPLREEPVLAASVHRFDDEQTDVEDDDEDEIIILDDEPAPKKSRRDRDEPVLEAHAPLDAAPLEIAANDDRPSLLPVALAASGVARGTPLASPRVVHTIDPF
jgi:hypothetical protein